MNVLGSVSCTWPCGSQLHSGREASQCYWVNARGLHLFSWLANVFGIFRTHLCAQKKCGLFFIRVSKHLASWWIDRADHELVQLNMKHYHGIQFCHSRLLGCLQSGLVRREESGRDRQPDNVLSQGNWVNDLSCHVTLGRRPSMTR